MTPDPAEARLLESLDPVQRVTRSAALYDQGHPRVVALLDRACDRRNQVEFGEFA